MKRSARKVQKGDPRWYVSKAKDASLPVTPPVEVRYDSITLSPTMQQMLTARGYEMATPIQAQTIPDIITGSDMVGVAQTGTGKTGAFLIPLVERIIADPRTCALIVLPTRELAGQVEDELIALTGRYAQVRSALLIGGVPQHRQVQALRRAPHVIIGTPGRIKDLIEQGLLKMQYFSYVVLDEVDRMLDMGFIQDIKLLISLLPKERQSLFFSATLTSEVRHIIGSFAPQAKTVTLASTRPAENVDQDMIKVPYGTHKADLLTDLLSKGDIEKSIIFVRTKHGVDRLARHLESRDHRVTAIHGDKEQRKRERAIRQFKDGETNILIATDVVARGIDISDVTHVINYDEPATYEDYVHRVGRAGRGGRKGYALTLVE